jgi:hypothetical protein
MRILVYKRTHPGDPDPTGQFGIGGCMGRVRGLEYDAVIGVGGVGAEPRSYGINGRINWVGVGPKKDWGAAQSIDPRGPLVRFEKYKIWEEQGPPLHVEAPLLARRLYEKGARYVLDLSPAEQREAEILLEFIESTNITATKKATKSDCAAKTRTLKCPPKGRC